MKFLGLTKNNGEKIVVQLQHLVAFEEIEKTDGCRLYLRDAHWVDVAESYHSIFDVINRNGVDC